MKDNRLSDFTFFPKEPKNVGVLIDIEHRNTEIITADNEEEYRSKISEIKKRLGDNYIEVKQIVGVVIPVSTESLP